MDDIHLTSISSTTYRPEWHLNKGPPVCTGCEKMVTTSMVIMVQGRPWHANCLRCTECSLRLQPTCYLHRDMPRRPYCQQHFFRRFGPRCSGCKELIPPAALVMRAHHNVYHPECFRCAVCDRSPRAGSEFHLTYDREILCERDYKEMKQHAQEATTNFLALLNCPNTVHG